jgi:ribosomal protein S18 acetylase RimI-like enzyme
MYASRADDDLATRRTGRSRFSRPAFVDRGRAHRGHREPASPDHMPHNSVLGAGSNPHRGVTRSVSHPARIEDLDLLAASHAPMLRCATALEATPLSDHGIGTLALWSMLGEARIGVIGDHVCAFHFDDVEALMLAPPLPLHAGAARRTRSVVAACLDLLDQANEARGSAGRTRIEAIPDDLAVRASRWSEFGLAAGFADHVYETAALASLAGRRWKSRRHERTHFERDHPEARLVPLTPDLVPGCLELLSTWRSAADDRGAGESGTVLAESGVPVATLRGYESMAVEALLRRWSEWCDVLEADAIVEGDGDHAQVLGFTIGDRLSSSHAVTVVEKVDHRHDGIAAWFWSRCCQTRWQGVAEINACDDWGVASLRRTKRSWHPTRLLPKCVLTRQGVIIPNDASRIATLDLGPAAVGIGVRDATPADLDAIERLERLGFERAEERFDRRRIRDLMRSTHAAVRVAVSETATLGWGVSLVRRDPGGRMHGRVHAIAVDPAARGMGVGRVLLADLLEGLQRSGVIDATLEVRVGNASAEHLYRAAGFVPVAIVPDYYGEGVDALRMRRWGFLGAG